MNKNNLTKTLFFFFTFITIINNIFGRTIYVNQQVLSNQQDGNNWEHAYANLKTALFEAQYGDTIWVAKGTYFPVSNLRNDAFFIKNGISVFGGFNGTETVFEQRDIQLNRTILSGERGDTAILEDNHFHVVSMTNVDSTTTLDGFTITRGYADDGITASDEKNFLGGGLLLETTRDSFNTVPKILNCRFIKNTARRGGAIYCNGKEEEHRLVNPIIDNCLFQGNFARWAGGAISKKEGGDYFEIKNSIFLENVAGFNYGGAIHFCNSFGVNKITNCHFEKDSALISQGGAIFYEAQKKNSKLYLKNTQFLKNYTRRGGGAITLFFSDLRFCKPAPKHEVFINNCVFNQNSTSNTGGAINLSPFGSQFLIFINNTIFSNNYATFSGASIHSEILTDTVKIEVNKCKFINNGTRSIVDGNIYLRTTGSNASSYHQLILKNSLLANNNTGAYAAYNGQFDGKVTSEIINCTFYKNGLSPISKNWSADFDGITRYNNMKIVNSIFHEEPNIFNNNNPSMEEIFFNNNLDSLHLADYKIQNCWINVMPITNCDTACGKDLIFGENPLFANPSNGDFSLRPCSPAVDSGNNAFLPDNFKVDILGNPRIKNSIVDIGAYENDSYQPISIETEQINASSSSSADGQIAIKNIRGRNPPYQYMWSNGDTATSIQNLSPEKYSLTITDSNGCSEEFEFEVSFTSSIYANHHKFSSVIFPNPIFNNFTTIEINSNKKENLAITIYDVMGKLVNYQALKIEIGKNNYALQTPQSKGFYWLIIADSKNNLLGYHKIQVL